MTQPERKASRAERAEQKRVIAKLNSTPGTVIADYRPCEDYRGEGPALAKALGK